MPITYFVLRVASQTQIDLSVKVHVACAGLNQSKVRNAPLSHTMDYVLETGEIWYFSFATL